MVDDNPDVLAAVSLTLERAGYEVETTTDVFGLPLKVGTFKPDVILLDVDLPAISGDKLATNLKKLRSTKDCKIVFHSGEDESLLASLVRQTGADGFIPKGLPKAALLSKLRGFVGEPQP